MKHKKGQALLGNIVLLVIFLVIISVGGLLAGMLYFDMNILDSALRPINFTLPIQEMSQSGNMTTLQDVLGITVYPLLGLRTTLPYLTYFMVFAFIIALGMVAYLSSKTPVFFTLHVLFTILITYFSIILSNTYKELISNPFINSMMLPFTIYNKLMLYLPQIIFFTSLVFGVIAFINLIKPQTNESSNQVNYGGDFD